MCANVCVCMLPKAKQLAETKNHLWQSFSRGRLALKACCRHHVLSSLRSSHRDNNKPPRHECVPYNKLQNPLTSLCANAGLDCEQFQFSFIRFFARAPLPGVCDARHSPRRSVCHALATQSPWMRKASLQRKSSWLAQARASSALHSARPYKTASLALQAVG